MSSRLVNIVTLFLGRDISPKTERTDYCPSILESVEREEFAWNLRCSLIQAVNQEEPSDRKPDPWPLWMAGHAQLEFVMTECSKTQILLTGLIKSWKDVMRLCISNVPTENAILTVNKSSPAVNQKLLNWFIA